MNSEPLLCGNRVEEGEAITAGALSFATGEELEFACWDNELPEAVREHGFTLIPQ
jgi:hypothetical protein